MHNLFETHDEMDLSVSGGWGTNEIHVCEWKLPCDGICQTMKLTEDS